MAEKKDYYEVLGLKKGAGEDEIKKAFVPVVNTFFASKDAIIADFTAIQADIFDTTALEKRRRELQNEITITAELIQKGIEEKHTQNVVCFF